MSPTKEEKSEGQEKIEQLGVLEGLRKYAQDHVLLVGKPGSGKSTALKRLLLEEAENALSDDRVKIPVLVELRYYQTSMLDAIGSFLRRHGLWMEKAEIEKQLFEGRWLLLVDGLNELPDDAARQEVKVFRQNNLHTPMIFTTRVLGMGGNLDISKQLEMLPLTESQTQDFVKDYLPDGAEQMLGQLGERLQEFRQTPLLLWMLCSVFDETGKVPPNLGLVFRQFTQKFQQELKESVPENSRNLWQLLLKYLAFRMTQGREATEFQVAIPRQQAEEILTELLRNQNNDQPHASAISGLQDLLKHHLIQLGSDDQIEFRHQLIQEYYTAEYLLEQLKTLSDNLR